MFVLHSSLVAMELVALARLLEAMSFVTVDSGVAAGVAVTIEAVENAVVEETSMNINVGMSIIVTMSIKNMMCL
jgi:hypothetical protein